MRSRIGRLVARLGALALDRFQLRAAFPADVPAGAHEDFHMERQIGAEDVVAQQSLLAAAVDFRFEDGFLFLILVTNVKKALLRPYHQGADDHAFDHQVGQVRHDEAVFDGAGLALVRVADQILFFARRISSPRPT